MNTQKVVNRREVKEVSSYSQLLNEAHQQGLEEIFTRILIFPEPEKQVKALVWGKVKMAKGFFTALGEADSVESAEEKAKFKALKEALNKGKEVKKEKEERAENIEVKDKERVETSSREEDADFEPMTDAQKRYLFRLLAQKNIRNESAYDYLKEAFQVDSLKQVSKGQASLKIEEILNGAEVS